MMLMRRLWLLMLCSLVLGTLLGLTGCGKKAGSSTTEAADAIAKALPQADFQSKVPQMKDGMSYSELVALLGGVQGKDTSLPETANTPESSKGVKTYQWVDADKNLLMCSFKDDKLVFKNIDTMALKAAPAAK